MIVQFSDLVSLIAVTISILTLAATLYFQFGKPPKLVITPAENLSLYYENDGRLVLRSNLTFFNLGARYLGVRKIVGSITRNSDGLSMGFEWFDFFKVVTVSSTGKFQKPWTEFDRPLHTIIIPGYRGVNQSITFSTNRPFDISQGVYNIEYIAYTIPVLRKTVSTKHTVRIEKEAAEHLAKNCIANSKGVYKESLVLRLTP